MSPSAPFAGTPFAHPLTEPYLLPVPPLVAGVVAMLGVLAVAVAWPERADHSQPAPRAREHLEVWTDSWSGPLSQLQVSVRAVALALLLFTIAAGRLGAASELENLAPALVVGVAWPMLALLSISAGSVWRWVDPWDGAARLLSRGERGRVSEHVWLAILPAVAWTWYLSAWPNPLSPRAVGAAVALYTIFTLTGCFAGGRIRWLSRTEPLGLMLSWMALLPAGRLGRWNPPRGAEALLGVIAGGVVFGVVRRSELWGELNVAPAALWYATVGTLLLCGTFGGLLTVLARQTKRLGSQPVLTQAVVPALPAIIIAVALDRNRLTTSLQLIPGLLGDPFGWGWDLLGRPGAGLDPAPLGVTGLAVAQLTVLLAGHLAGAIVLGRGAPRLQRGPAAGGLAILAGVSVVGLLAH